MSIFRRVQLIVPIMLVALVSVSLSAQTMGHGRWAHRDHRPDYVGQTLHHLLSQAGNKRLSQLSAAELRKALGELSVARQKQAYVRRSATASFFVPGAGQFMDHAPAAGALFLTGHLAVAAGTIVGAYFLLPKDLQFGTTNYLTDSFQTIKTRWMAHNLVDYLPSAAIMAGGMLVDHVLRAFAAKNAAEIARANIKNKKVVFRPEPLMVIPGPHGPRMGFGWNMRF